VIEQNTNGGGVLMEIPWAKLLEGRKDPGLCAQRTTRLPGIFNPVPPKVSDFCAFDSWF
jgi:hypothetical protein